MVEYSAGILLYKFKNGKLHVLLVHPGGPFWQKRDNGAWSIPKGKIEENETPFDAAKREFKEETGFIVDGNFIELGELRQPSGKIVHIWALEKDVDETRSTSNMFALEWPKGSGKMQEFPEIDRVAWFDIEQARRKILNGQKGFIDLLVESVNYKVARAQSTLF
ncbi:MAG: NUDIX hydrolase [Candidatus Altiarchaeales archaeon HGW-Altiarchaeales-2]|nr:MAG: NUDIX hydrolase [Candidatus Altiarchaeales archaeon HGW-Altiarchaeales-2]